MLLKATIALGGVWICEVAHHLQLNAFVRTPSVKGVYGGGGPCLSPFTLMTTPPSEAAYSSFWTCCCCCIGRFW
jgi:hypothetical protein